MNGSHSSSELHQEDAKLLECHSTGVDFWDVDLRKFEYCPACGEKL